MNELKVQSSRDIINEKLSRIIGRTDIQTTPYARRVIQELYFEMIKRGDFCIESLIEQSQLHDESLLYEIAEEEVRINPDFKYYERCKELHGDDTYDEILDEIMNEYIMDYGVMLCLTVPPYSKASIPYEFSYIIDNLMGSYYVIYPPPGSFQAYVGNIKLEIWYNDAQNSLCEECATIDQSDNSIVSAVRPIPEKIVYIEDKEVI